MVKKDIGAQPREEHNTSPLKVYNLPFMGLLRVIKCFLIFRYALHVKGRSTNFLMEREGSVKVSRKELKDMKCTLT